MKALMCVCGTLHSPPTDGAWSLCQCGNAACRWVAPPGGEFAVWATDLSNVRVLGLHNGMIETVFLDGLRGISDVDNTAFRTVHSLLCRAPGYLFDASKRGCWATLVAENETSDITWTTERPDMSGAGE